MIQRVETMQSEIEEAHREAKEAWQAVKDKEKEVGSVNVEHHLLDSTDFY